MKTLFKMGAALMMAALFAMPCFAQTTPVNYQVTATVPTQFGLIVSATSIDANGTPGPSDDIWGTPVPNGNVSFGTLTLDTDNMVFISSSYYAVDVAIIANSGWTSLLHSATSVTNGTDNLDNNINVTTIACSIVGTDECATSGTTAIDIQKLSYTSAMSMTVTPVDVDIDIAGQWLRIFYGLSSGNDPLNPQYDDNPGVSPVPASQPSGSYTGTITLTLS